jgi:predicted transcriptional regulator of viral defense system
MKWESLLKIVANKPVFSAAQLMSEDESPRQMSLQLSHWAKNGQLVQLRNGLYALALGVREESCHPFLIANQLQPESYVSVQSALSFCGMIPEYVPVTTSVGPGRQDTLRN